MGTYFAQGARDLVAPAHILLQARYVAEFYIKACIFALQGALRAFCGLSTSGPKKERAALQQIIDMGR